MWPIKLRQIINFKTRSNFADAKMWKEGNSLAVQGWGLSAYTAVTQVQFLVKELRSCQPWGAAFKKKKWKENVHNRWNMILQMNTNTNFNADNSRKSNCLFFKDWIVSLGQALICGSTSLLLSSLVPTTTPFISTLGIQTPHINKPFQPLLLRLDLLLCQGNMEEGTRTLLHWEGRDTWGISTWSPLSGQEPSVYLQKMETWICRRG